jgi:vacuolar-type H+-ATPase subunit I/STV1
VPGLTPWSHTITASVGRFSRPSGLPRRAKKISAKAVQAESILEEGFEGEVELRNLLSNYKSQVEDLKKQLAIEQSRKGNEEELNELKVQREHLNNRIERLSVLALAAGDSRNPIVQQVPPCLMEIANEDHYDTGIRIIYAV